MKACTARWNSGELAMLLMSWSACIFLGGRSSDWGGVGGGRSPGVSEEEGVDGCGGLYQVRWEAVGEVGACLSGASGRRRRVAVCHW